MKLKQRPKSQPTCPLCLGDLEGKLRRCTDCATEVHKDCTDEFGKKCPTIGCGGKLKKLKHSEAGPVELKIHPGGKNPLKTQLEAGEVRWSELARREAAEREVRARQMAGRGHSAPPRFIGGRVRGPKIGPPPLILLAMTVASTAFVYILWRVITALIGG